MKRGRPATRGIDDAVAIALRRGCVMRVMYSSQSVCDFFIRTVMHVIFVRSVRFEKITASIREIEHECRGIIAELRLFPPSHQIRLELWIYSRHGTYRFFRLTGAGLEEIRQDGEIAPAIVPAPPSTPVVDKSVPVTVPENVKETDTSPSAVPVTDSTPEAVPGRSQT
jgi:hypothetical protein